LQKKSIKEIDLVHLDVQGAEEKVIIGAKNTKMRIVFAEVSEEDSYVGAGKRSSLDALMYEKGYVLVKELKFDNLYLLKDDYAKCIKNHFRNLYYYIQEKIELIIFRFRLKVLKLYNKLIVQRRHK
jgi:hypothetical protein